VSRISIATLRLNGQSLILLPEKAVFFPQSDTLLVANAYVGKSTGFRNSCTPDLINNSDATLDALTDLVKRLQIKNIIFLSGFLHEKTKLSPELFSALQQWRDLHRSVRLILVHGDRQPPAALVSLEMEITAEPLVYQGFTLCHQKQFNNDDSGFFLSGYMHPCVNIGGIGDRTHNWLRLPCFWFSDQMGVLPSFGSLAGMQPIRAKRGERVFAVAAHRVFELRPTTSERLSTSL
jgi:uncharacterized protein